MADEIRLLHDYILRCTISILNNFRDALLKYHKRDSIKIDSIINLETRLIGIVYCKYSLLQKYVIDDEDDRPVYNLDRDLAYINSMIGTCLWIVWCDNRPKLTSEHQSLLFNTISETLKLHPNIIMDTELMLCKLWTIKYHYPEKAWYQCSEPKPIEIAYSKWTFFRHRYLASVEYKDTDGKLNNLMILNSRLKQPRNLHNIIRFLNLKLPKERIECVRQPVDIYSECFVTYRIKQ
jgi:hypothetical protein